MENKRCQFRYLHMAMHHKVFDPATENALWYKARVSEEASNPQKRIITCLKLLVEWNHQGPYPKNQEPKNRSIMHISKSRCLQHGWDFWSPGEAEIPSNWCYLWEVVVSSSPCAILASKQVDNLIVTFCCQPKGFVVFGCRCYIWTWGLLCFTHDIHKPPAV